MMDRPQISVLLPVHNGVSFLRAAIESILAQDLTDLELIIVDDGSDDGTDKVIEICSGMDRRVRPIRAGRIGLVASLEIGRAAVRSAFVARMDADDVAFPSRLRLQMAYLDVHPRTVAVGGQIQKIDDRGVVVGKGRYPLTIEECRRYLSMGSPFCHPAVTMRADALHACGGYREKYRAAEDYDLWQRLALHGDIANIPEIILQYRVHANNLTLKNARANAVAAALSLLEANGLEVNSFVDEMQTACLLDPEEILRMLPGQIKDQFMRHYIRFLTLNGGIGEGYEEAISLLESYASIEGIPREEVAFTLTRAMKILTMKKKVAAASGVFMIGVRKCPTNMFTHMLSHGSQILRV
jgi:hypothetical protein